MAARQGGRSPSTTWRSVRQTAQARTFNKSSPGLGAGISRTSNAKGWPGAFKTIALMGSPPQEKAIRSYHCRSAFKGLTSIKVLFAVIDKLRMGRNLKE